MIEVFGASYATSQAMKAALASAANTAVTLHGIGGVPITQWAAQLPAPGSMAGKVIVVLELGGNGIPSAEAVRDADRALWASGASLVLWCVFTGWPDAALRAKREETGRIVRANARVSAVLPTPRLDVLTSDHVHLTPDGYRTLGTLIATKIAAAIAGGNARTSGASVGIAVTGTLLSMALFVAWKTLRLKS